MLLITLLYKEGNEETKLILVLLNTHHSEGSEKNEYLMKTSGNSGRE